MSKKIILGGALLVLIAGLSAWLFLGRGKTETVSVKRGSIIEAIYTLGTVKANRRFEVKIGVLGRVTKIFVQEGDYVHKGAPLIQFDVGDAFHAPFAGTVVLVAPFVGEVVTPQTVALRMEDMSNRYIELSLEQEAALRTRKGQKARISLESLRGELLKGEVTAIYSRESEFLARVDILNLNPNILPGMTADVAIEVGKTDNALLIPLAGVSRGQVTVRRANGQVEKIKVELGNVENGWGEVRSSNIAEDDQIFVPKGFE